MLDTGHRPESHDPLPLSRRRFAIVAIGVLAFAAALRLFGLGARPPHHDEGVNGFFVERMLLSHGYYAYDPHNFHGPLPFYLFYWFRRMCGFGIVPLRAAVALVGVAACAVPLVGRRRLGSATALAVAALLATSPSLVYFARDAIHETPLVAALLTSIFVFDRWAERPSSRWLTVAGVAVAVMFAIKETAILLVAAWLPFAALELARTAKSSTRPPRSRLPLRLLEAALAATAVWIVAFTGLFRAPSGTWSALRRSFEAYLLWGHRGVSGSEQVHGFGYFLGLLWRYDPLIVLLALPGLALGFRSRLVRICGAAGLTLLLLHSVMPYKTPWLVINIVALLAVPAGSALARALRSPAAAGAVVALLIPIASAGHLAFAHATDPAEPLVYAQTVAENHEWMDPLASARREGLAPRLRIRSTAMSAWPLPYLLQPFRHVRWGPPLPMEAADLVFADADSAPAVESALRGSYRARRYVLRPGVPLFVYYREPLATAWFGARRLAPPFRSVSGPAPSRPLLTSR